jgi:hypothetical protein
MTVLGELSAIRPLELIQAVIPVAFASAYFAVSARINPEIAVVRQAYAEIDAALVAFHAASEQPLVEYRRVALDVARRIENACFEIACAHSLLGKLSGCVSAVNTLMASKVLQLASEVERAAVVGMFRAMNIDFRNFLIAQEDFYTGEMNDAIQQLYVGQFKKRVIIASILREQL